MKYQTISPFAAKGTIYYAINFFSNGDLFTCEDNVLFSCVKICFRVKALLVFHWCLYNNSDYFVAASKEIKEIPGKVFFRQRACCRFTPNLRSGVFFFGGKEGMIAGYFTPYLVCPENRVT